MALKAVAGCQQATFCGEEHLSQCPSSLIPWREARLGSQWQSGSIVCTKGLVYLRGRAETHSYSPSSGPRLAPSPFCLCQGLTRGLRHFQGTPASGDQGITQFFSLFLKTLRFSINFPQSFNTITPPPLFFSTQKSSVPSSEPESLAPASFLW